MVCGDRFSDQNGMKPNACYLATMEVRFQIKRNPLKEPQLFLLKINEKC